MQNNARPDKQLSITINGHQVIREDKFMYLGATTPTSGDHGAELPIRIGMASGDLP
jgi:BRCT domain type II-containing protein